VKVWSLVQTRGREGAGGVLGVDERAWRGKRASGSAMPFFIGVTVRRGGKRSWGGGGGRGRGTTHGGRRSIEKGGPGSGGEQCGQPTTAQPWRARAARHGPNRGGAGVSDTWAPAGSRRERERRGAGTRGPAQEKEERAKPG
jgi:hypothetical protein